jgi:hypothetical protein
MAALAATAGWTGTLTLADARTFPVAFRDEGVLAEPAQRAAPRVAGTAFDTFTLTVKLQTV